MSGLRPGSVRLHDAVQVPESDRTELGRSVRGLLDDPNRSAAVERTLAEGRWAVGRGGRITAGDLSGRDPGAIRGAVLAVFLDIDPRAARSRVRTEGLTFVGHADPRERSTWSGLLDLVPLCRRRQDWTGDEVLLLWWHASQFRRLTSWWGWHEVLRAPITAAASSEPSVRSVLASTVTSLTWLVQEADASFTPPDDRRRVLRKLGELAAREDSGIPPHLLDPDELFGAFARDRLRDETRDGVVGDVVSQLATYASGVRAAARWRRSTLSFLAEDVARPPVVVRLLEIVTEYEGEVVEWADGGVTVEGLYFVDDATAQLLRAATWACGDLVLQRDGDDPDRARLLDVLLSAAEHCGTVRGATSMTRCPQVTSSTVAFVSELDADEAAPALERLRAAIRNKALRTAIASATQKVAERAGISVEQLAERTVPTFDLDPSGSTVVHVGPAEAVVTATSPTRFGIRWRGRGDRLVATIPAAVREQAPDGLEALRVRLRAASKVLAAQRDRLESMLATGNRWTGADWAAHCVGHPVTGRIAGTLLWRVWHAGTTTTGMPDRDADGWVLVDLDGRRRPVRDDDEVDLWHPLLTPVEEVLAWRDRLLVDEVRQPFRQAFREVYVPTEAEHRTETYSNRFAAHVLDHHRARALMRARGWDVGYLGPWDGGDETLAVRELPGTGWSATYRIGRIDDLDQELCATDRVCFVPGSGAAAGVPTVVADVPPLVFSEGMRDVDLFVGVASVAADPAWFDRGPDAVAGYWSRESGGPLGEAASVRRDALVRILPRTRIADRVDVGERYLTVRGDVRTYRVHIGSGGILMSPDDQYLCIVRGGRASEAFLPFEDDGGRLSDLLSKAFLLADDAEITDPVILDQIRARSIEGGAS